MTSYHYTYERQERENVIKSIGYGNIIKSVVIDRGHRNGPEIHELSDTGIINIYNQFTHKLITKLIASPNQVRRYYTGNERPPRAVINLAIMHVRAGYNLN